MARPLRVLLVEDSARDAALLQLYLRRGGYDPQLQRVDTLVDLQTQLQSGAWDLIVTDFNLPGFDAFAAIDAVQHSGRDVPVIVASADSAVGDRITAAGVRFILKYQMRDIVPIIDELMRGRA